MIEVLIDKKKLNLNNFNIIIMNNSMVRISLIGWSFIYDLFSYKFYLFIISK